MNQPCPKVLCPKCIWRYVADKLYSKNPNFTFCYFPSVWASMQSHEAHTGFQLVLKIINWACLGGLQVLWTIGDPHTSTQYVWLHMSHTFHCHNTTTMLYLWISPPSHPMFRYICELQIWMICPPKHFKKILLWALNDLLISWNKINTKKA